MRPSTRLCLLCVSNLLTAFAGGAILANSMGLLSNEPTLKGEAPLAFLLGSVLGLWFLLVTPGRWKHRSTAACSALSGGVAVLLLATLLTGPPVLTGAKAWGFFLLLCLHFGFWTAARAVRSDIAAGATLHLPWVEFSYYLGIIAGLGASRLGLDKSVLGIERALTADVALQLIAALLDFIASHKADTTAGVPTQTRRAAFPVGQFFPLAGAITLLTAGIEGAFFGLVQRARDGSTPELATDLWAASYAGPAVAAAVCAGAGFRLVWPPGGIGDAGTVAVLGRSPWRLPLSVFVWTTGALLLVAALAPQDRMWDRTLLIVTSAMVFFGYEIVYLAIADRLGLCAKAANRPGLVAITLGVMGVAATAATAIAVHEAIPSWLLLLVSCAGATAVLVRDGSRASPAENPLFSTTPPDPPAVFAAQLLEERRLPASAYYSLPPSSACWWATFSRDESRIRRKYEGDSWDALGVGDWVARLPEDLETCLLGLAVGEGLGEVELLRRLLARPGPVHYLAVDASPELLLVHMQTVRDLFGHELQTGRLRMAAVRGNIFHLRTVLGEARMGFAEQGVAFFPAGAPVCCSCLGNVLGNEHDGGQEVRLLRSVQAELGVSPLCFLAGVSVDRGVPDTFNREWTEYLLQPAWYLEQDLALIRSSVPGGEFRLGSGKGDGAENPQENVERRAAGPGVADAAVYRFRHKVRGRLSLTGSDLQVEIGESLLLYSVVKYVVSDLIRVFTEAGFSVRYRADHRLVVEAAGEVREYTVIAVFSQGDEPPE